MAIAATPAAPYYAVIFTSLRTEGDDGYGRMAEAMVRVRAGLGEAARLVGRGVH